MTFDELLKLVSTMHSKRQNNTFGLPDNAPHLCMDSRLVKTGDIFVAVKGSVCDGHDFIDQAVANGAEFIVAQQPYSCNGAKVIIVENSAKAAAVLAQANRGNPASKLTNLAVTGTNGKTTVTFLVRSVIQTAGERCGLIGTIICDTGLRTSQAVLTTPDCLFIADSQSQMLKAGSKYVIMEASSHGLSQNRLAGINFMAAAFTNLTDDHLDYHKTKEEYLAAKTKLFQALSPDSVAVLNKESPHAEEIARKTKARILWYGIDTPADITAHIESMDITGTLFVLECAGFAAVSKVHMACPVQGQRVKTPLLGRYNVSNHLAAAGLSLAAGFDLKTIAFGLSALQAIPGRLEKVDWDGDFSVFIDYAHTADALKNVLSTLKPLCRGRLIVVFGCGGDRDRTKRPNMAKVAEELADFVIVTNDNPRTERPADIISDITAGFKNPESKMIAIKPDRKKAIKLALRNADKDDIVLIAGKGHESRQIIGGKKFDFNDKTVAWQALRKRG